MPFVLALSTTSEYPVNSLESQSFALSLDLNRDEVREEIVADVVAIDDSIFPLFLWILHVAVDLDFPSSIDPCYYSWLPTTFSW